MTVAAWEMLKMHSMEGKALRQASDASDVMFSLELSQNVHSKDSLSRHPSETVEQLQGAPSSDVADIQRLLRLARPQNDFETQLLEVVRSVRAPFADSERDCSTAYLATQLRQRGYITQQRNARPKECGKACGRTCLEKLQHTYILVTGSLDSAVTMPVVVEQNFRENFSIASATPAYERLLAAAPGEFAGSVSRLAAIVEILSEGIKRAFAEQGLPLPPWRRAKSVMSKWGMGPNAHASEDEAVPLSSPSKRPAVGGNAPPPPPPPRGADAAQRERKPPRSASHERSGRSASLQLRTSEGLEAMLEQVGATLAPGKQQALQVSRDHGKHGSEDGSGAGAPVRVAIAADASGDAARTRQAKAERQAPPRAVTNLRGGSAIGEPSQAKSRSADLLRGGSGDAEQTAEQDSSRPSSAPAKGPKVKSLLAQGLADQAAATQHLPKPRAEAAPKQAAEKPQQAPWFSNLPHINTVRRIGKAGNEGKP